MKIIFQKKNQDLRVYYAAFAMIAIPGILYVLMTAPQIVVKIGWKYGFLFVYFLVLFYGLFIFMSCNRSRRDSQKSKGSFAKTIGIERKRKRKNILSSSNNIRKSR